MALGLLILTDGTMKVVEPKVAVEAYKALTGETEPTEQQADFLIRIRRIFIPPAYRPDNYEPIESPFKGDTVIKDIRPLDDPKSHLTNEGVLQGMSEQLPRGDR